MGLYEKFPYLNYHDLNLNWILATVKELSTGANGIPELVKQAKESADAAAEAAAEAQSYRDYNNANDTIMWEYLGSWIASNAQATAPRASTSTASHRVPTSSASPARTPTWCAS